MKRVFVFSAIFIAITSTTLLARIINIPADYSTIQAGIDSSANGDTVLVQPGIYHERINFNGHNIILSSLFLTTYDTAYISNTIIDRDSTGTLVTFSNGEDSATAIIGLTIGNPSGQPGGGRGIICIGASPLIKNNKIINNSIFGYGGGILCMASSHAVIINNTISRNAIGGGYGAAIACISSNIIIINNIINDNFTVMGNAAGIFCQTSDCLIDSNLIINNSTGGSGGAIYTSGSNCIITNNELNNNLANYLGGGIYCQSSNDVVMDNIININTGGQGGGGVYCSNSSTINITGNTINADTGMNGGAIFCVNSTATIESNSMNGNVSRFLDDYGGGFGSGIYSLNSQVEIRENEISNGTGNGIFCDSCSETVINGNILSGNIGDDGGGIFCNNCQVTISSNSIMGNAAIWDGGGIFYEGSEGVISGDAIMDNRSNSGGGFYCLNSNPFVKNNIFAGNAASEDGGGVFILYSNPLFLNNTLSRNLIDSSNTGAGGGLYARGSNFWLINSIVWGDSAIQGKEIYAHNSVIYIFACDIDSTGLLHNIFAEPLFRNPDNNDFHLMAIGCGDSVNSPCIDRGDGIDTALSCSWGLGTVQCDIGAYGGGDTLVTNFIEPSPEIPAAFSLSQNYPNPFNPTTTIKYSLTKSAYVTIEIYDLLGRKVETLFDAQEQAGYHQIIWNGDRVSSGIYFYRIQAGDFSETKKMLLLK
jgi:hypothetical protein